MYKLFGYFTGNSKQFKLMGWLISIKRSRRNLYSIT